MHGPAKPVAVVQGLTSALAATKSGPGDDSRTACHQRLDVAGRTAALAQHGGGVLAQTRRRHQFAHVVTNPARGHAEGAQGAFARMLYMVEEADGRQVRVIEQGLHGVQWHGGHVNAFEQRQPVRRAAFAQRLAEKAIHLVDVPGAARQIGEPRIGQQVVVENRTGAGGSIAADNVAKSPPDGYSVLLGNIGSHALVPHLYRKPAYNAVTDLETVAWIGTQPNLLCCHPNFEHNTLPKLIAAAKKDPGKYSFGSSGLGTSPTLTMELFKQKTGVDITFISYRGAAAAAADVLAGHLPMVISNIDSLMGQVSA
eukprot:gene610-807_t